MCGHIFSVGKHLAEHCRNEYEKVPNFILWILAEISIVACDIPEGTDILLIFFYKLRSSLSGGHIYKHALIMHEKLFFM